MNSRQKQAKKPAAREVLQPAHETFIHAMIQGATATQAYLEAYPTSSREAAYTSSSRLMDRPEIRERIRQGKDEARQRRNIQARQDIVNNIERIDARLLTLADVINGDWIRKDTRINKDTGVIIEHYRQDPGVAIQAIKLEIRLMDIRERLVADLSLIDTPPFDDKDDLRSMSEEELDETIRQLLKATDFQLEPLSVSENNVQNDEPQTNNKKTKQLKT